MYHLVRTWHRFYTLFESWWRWPIVKLITLICMAPCIVVTVLVINNWLFTLPVFDPLKPVEIAQTQIVRNTLSLHRLGTWSVVDGTVERPIIVDESSVAFLVWGSLVPGFGHKVVVLHPESGGFVWNDIRFVRSLATYQNFVYVGDTSRVYAYDTETGENVWEYRKQQDTHGAMHIFVEGNKLKVYDHIASQYFITDIIVLDAVTGEHLYTENPSPPIPSRNFDIKDYTVSETAKFKYSLQSDKRTINIEDRQTGNQIGSLEMSVSVNKIVASDRILVVYNETNHELIVFERTDIEP